MARDYITTAELRAAPYSITTAEAADGWLADLILQATTNIDQWAGQRFDLQTAIAKSADGTNNEILVLPERCISFTAITINDLSLSAAELALVLFDARNAAHRGWSLHWKRGPWLPGFDNVFYEVLAGTVYPGGRMWRAGFQNVTITGNWGWSAIEPNVRRAAGLWILTQARPDSAIGYGLQFDSETIGSYSYRKPSAGPGTKKSISGDTRIDQLLEPYVRGKPLYLATNLHTQIYGPSQ